jgi:hypothetical protein
MFDSRGVLAHRRVVLAVCVLVASTVSALLVTVSLDATRAHATIEDSLCPGAQACFWDQPSYSGQEADFGGAWCCNQHTFDQFEWNSAKNRLNGRSIKLYQNDNGDLTIKACLDPNENRPDPGRFNAFQMQNNAC